MTFSIVARSADHAWLGVATATRSLAVGAAVPAAAAGVGALATQAFTNRAFRAQGLESLRDGAAPDHVLDLLGQGDPGWARRQVAIVDARGRSAVWTGPGCTAWAGSEHGDDYAVAGNLLTGSQVVEAMARTFVAADGSTAFAHLLVDVLRAGQAAGGDARGRQSAALLVVPCQGAPGTPAHVDLRVDDHADPVAELARLLDLHDADLPATVDPA
ncbi:DUF1028 domain-containing protein [Oerskovia flava]|uniref:DUF1028 domain-containing protein n=1 Tax=Oerskovia flava TaxID=2986422 RepID=UPI00223FF8F1|nr:DUF1028 domain-containing protein [Oerskovia sp. JB1-3-2]